jgi:hypothetical protein
MSRRENLQSEKAQLNRNRSDYSLTKDERDEAFILTIGISDAFWLVDHRYFWQQVDHRTLSCPDHRLRNCPACHEPSEYRERMEDFISTR